SMPKRAKNASRIPTLPRLRTSRPITIQRKAIPPAAVTTALDRIMAAVVIVAEIAAVVADGDAVVADAIAAGARRAAQPGVICLPRNMPRHRAASPADMIIAADRRAVTTIAARKLRAVRFLPYPASPKKRSFFRVNRWQNIAASQPLPPLRLP